MRHDFIRRAAVASVLMLAAITLASAQGKTEKVKAIRQAYAEAVEMTKIDEPHARTEMTMTLHRNLPGIGIQKRNVEFFGCAEYGEEGASFSVRLVRVSYNVAARKYYEEYLYDENGEPLFCYMRYDGFFAETTTKEELRYYFDGRSLCSFLYKAKDADTGKEIKRNEIPELFEMFDGSDYADRLPEFDNYRRLFDMAMNSNL